MPGEGRSAGDPVPSADRHYTDEAKGPAMTKNAAGKRQPEPVTDPPGLPPIINPRYAGATPEMVGRALLRAPVLDEEILEPKPGLGG